MNMPPPTHRYAGSDSERQSVGDPGHCEECAQRGHVAAHPDLGCGDVGCYRRHPEIEDVRAILARAGHKRSEVKYSDDRSSIIVTHALTPGAPWITRAVMLRAYAETLTEAGYVFGGTRISEWIEVEG